MSQADREDLRQDILLVLVTLAGGYAAQRGAWSTYLKLLARHAIADQDRARLADPVAGRADELPPDIPDPFDLRQHLILRLDLAGTVAALPPHLVRIVALVAEYGSVADAQHACDLPMCVFYRQVADLRMWLRAAGLTPLLRRNRRPVGK